MQKCLLIAWIIRKYVHESLYQRWVKKKDRRILEWTTLAFNEKKKKEKHYLFGSFSQINSHKSCVNSVLFDLLSTYSHETTHKIKIERKIHEIHFRPNSYTKRLNVDKKTKPKFIILKRYVAKEHGNATKLVDWLPYCHSFTQSEAAAATTTNWTEKKEKKRKHISIFFYITQ